MRILDRASLGFTVSLALAAFVSRADAQPAPSLVVPPPSPPPSLAVATSPEPPPPPPPLFGRVAPLPTGFGVGRDGNPLAGYHGGLFFLRDRDDNFRLYIQGRAQIDALIPMGPGVSDTALKPTLFLKRIRPEFSGEILKRWSFMFAGEFGQTGVDNPKGTTETSAAKPGAAPSATTARFASAQTSALRAGVTDVFLSYRAIPLLNLQLGQFDAPFTLENRTSDKYLPFMERSLAVRSLGIPTNKELGAMLWGENEGRHIFYSAGVFGGDGQNRLNVDNRADAMARVFAHPLSTHGGPLKDLQLGTSLRYGERQPSFVDYDYSPMTTQGGYAFWSPVYKGSKGFTHVLPSGRQLGLAGELRIPVGDFDVTSELVYVDNRTREAVEGFQASNTERLGSLKGYAYYVELGYWPFGHRDLNGVPGYENPAHLDFKKPAPRMPLRAFQMLIKWEQFHAKYDSAGREGTADANNIDGSVKVDVLQLGVNYWATKHLRLSANYGVNMFPGSAPATASKPGDATWSSAQRAVAPGNTIDKGIDDDARASAAVLHELMFRFAVAL